MKYFPIFLQQPQFYLALLISLVSITVAYELRMPFALDVGGQTDRPLLSWINDPEVEQATGIRYRWTTPGSEVILIDWGAGQPFELDLRLRRWRPDNTPSNLTIYVNDRKLASPQAKSTGWEDEQFIVSDQQFLHADDLHIKFVVETFELADQSARTYTTRQVGIQLDSVKILPLQTTNGQARAVNGMVFTPFGLAPRDITLYMVLSAGVLYAGLAEFKISRWLAFASVGLFSLAVAVGLILVRPYLTLFAQTFVIVLLSGVALAFLVRFLLPRFLTWGGVIATDWEQNILSVLFALGFVSKLDFLLYPQTISYDLLYHIHRLQDVMSGTLFWSIPSGANEFGGQAVPYLPSFYLLLTPLAQFIPLQLLVQLSGIVLDTLTIFFLYYWLKKYFADGRAGLFAAVIYLVVPLAFISLSWGIYANLYGQFIMLVLLVALFESFKNLASARAFMPVSLLFLLTLLSHTSVLVSIVPLFAVWMVLLVLGIGRTIQPRLLVALLGSLVLASVIAFVTYYSLFINLILQGTSQIGLDETTPIRREALTLLQLLQPARTEFNAVPIYLYGFALVGVLGLAYIARRAPSLDRFLILTLLIAWFAAFGVLLIVRAEFGFSTRYVNFFMPGIALCAGVVWSWIYARGVVGRIVSLGLALILAAQGFYHWYVLAMFKYH